MKYLVVLVLLQSCFLAFSKEYHQEKKENPSIQNCGFNSPSEPESGNRKDPLKPIYQQSGCCSHHGGVCGCSFGRAQCCDGALSPSCGC